MHAKVALLTLILIAACGKEASRRRNLEIQEKGEVQVIVTGSENNEEIRREAKIAGVSVSGEHVLILKGDADKIARLSFVTTENFDYMVDSELEVERPEPFTSSFEGLYQAKKDFGIPSLLRKYPTADGRGVKVGVIDDGISPHQAGLVRTSTGERKVLKKESPSSFTTYSLTETEGGLMALVDENRLTFAGKIDLNADGKFSTWKIFVPDGEDKICLDVNGDGNFEGECKGSFSSTGEYHLTVDRRLVLLAELDRTKKTVRLFQPERDGDSHGEGVASVLAGYSLGNVRGFDGVAPGAQILDYDLSEKSNKPEERKYTMATFLKALDWLGSEGAEVANVSYSLYFTSAKAQDFMNKAIADIVKKHNIVVSFSAGNNGPGLGSLNRRGIYPPSVLVAGAYISKELDERVHGVTGIPDEGRVVYYSSRGPGLGTGPLLISPLSSLVASTPTETYRAFSGTSSASPALAGAATVLISALKQENIPVNAATVVSALRLSGKRLKNEPFIFQGYGLPQVDEALKIYKSLIKGQEFEDVRVSIDRGSVDGVPVSGIFIRKSEMTEATTMVVRMRGVTSALSDTAESHNLLVPVRLIMSEGLSGPRELWVSGGQSQFGVDIDPDKVLKGKLEGFGEVQIISQLSGQLLAIVPVTVVNDLNVKSNPRVTFSVGSQEGVRLPLEVKDGVRAFKISARVISGDDKGLLVSVFDQNQIRTIQERIGNDIFVNTARPGFYQVGLSMRGGTSKNAKVELQVEEIRLQMKTNVTSAKKPVIRLENRGTQISVKLKLVPKSAPVARTIFTSEKLDQSGTITKKLEEGAYLISVRPTQSFELEYHQSGCFVSLRNPDETITISAGDSFNVPKNGAEAVVRCIPFDEGGTFSEVYSWELAIHKVMTSQIVRSDLGRNAVENVNFTEAPAGIYFLRAADPFSTNEIDLGEVELI